MNDFEMMKILNQDNKMENLVQKVKNLPVYTIYEHVVKDGYPSDHSTADILQSLVEIYSLGSEELRLLILSVSHDLLFALID